MFEITTHHYVSWGWFYAIKKDSKLVDACSGFRTWQDAYNYAIRKKDKLKEKS
jgi:hypothetical protein